MNKSIATLAACVVVGAMGFHALAQTGNQPKTGAPAAPPPSPGVVPVRVAVLNINTVLKNFNKAMQLNNFISQKVNSYGQQITAKRDAVTKLQAELAKQLDPNQAENLKKQMVALEREMQDLDAEARKDIGAQQNTIAVGIYRDIESVVQRVAVANGFDLVLSYPDATTDVDLYSQANVVRKLASQAAIPIFYKKHIDITDAVVQTLNATFPAPAPTTTAAPAPPTTPAANPITPVGGTAQPKR